MSYSDFSQHTIELQPLARQLYEHLSLQDVAKAENAVNLLLYHCSELKTMILKMQIKSGEGFR